MIRRGTGWDRMRHGVRGVLIAVAIVVGVVLATVGLGNSAQAAIVPGTLVVVVTDAVSAPLTGATVEATTDGTTWRGTTVSQPPGTYQLRLPPGSYRIRITAAGGLVDYVPGLPTIDGAATFPVVAGETTTVDEQLTQSGNVQVSLVDRVTGQPVADGCVALSGFTLRSPACDHPDGHYLFVAVPLGDHTITVSSTRTHWVPDPVQVTVAPGFADIPVQLDPAAAIQTWVQAADDGSVHPRFCVLPVYPTAATLSITCNDTVTGTILIGPLPAASVQLFAVPVEDFPGTMSEPVYGAQWVGAHGGTGEQRQAQRYQLTVGTVTTVPPIQVDHAGSITGVVDDTYYGNSGWDYYVQPFGLQPGLGFGWAYGVGISVAAPVGGLYTLTGLGPYAWPIEFSSRGPYADQWSGGAPDRYAATPVQVQAGMTSTLDATLVDGGGVSGSFYATAQTTPDQGWVDAVNAITGDMTGWDFVTGNTFEITGLSSDPVHLIYQPGDGHVYEYPWTVPTSGPLSTGVVLTKVTNATRSRHLGPAPGAPYRPRDPHPVAGQAAPFQAPASPPTPAPGTPGYPADAVSPRRSWRPAKPWFV